MDRSEDAIDDLTQEESYIDFDESLDSQLDIQANSLIPQWL